MLKCKQITEQASAYVDGELSLAMRLQYRIHLLMCHHCRRFISNFSAGVTMIKRLHQSRAHDQSVEQICRHIKDHQ